VEVLTPDPGRPSIEERAEIAEAARRGVEVYRPEAPDGRAWGVRQELPEPERRTPRPRLAKLPQPFRIAGRLADHHPVVSSVGLDGRQRVPVCRDCLRQYAGRGDLGHAVDGLSLWELSAILPEAAEEWPQLALDARRCLRCHVEHAARVRPYSAAWRPSVGSGPEPELRRAVPRAGLSDKVAEAWTAEIGEELDAADRGRPRDAVSLDANPTPSDRRRPGASTASTVETYTDHDLADMWDSSGDALPEPVPVELCCQTPQCPRRAKRKRRVNGALLKLCGSCHQQHYRTGQLPTVRLIERQRARTSSDYTGTSA
jgi:hypothetical protein